MEAKLLIVDSKPRNLLPFRLVLEDSLLVIEKVADETTARAKIRAWKPDVILVDNDMPGLRGMDLLKEAAAICPHSVRVLMTAAVDFPLVHDASRAKVTQFLAKPFLSTDFLDCMRAALAELQGKREARWLLEAEQKSNLLLWEQNLKLSRQIAARTAANARDFSPEAHVCAGAPGGGKDVKSASTGGWQMSGW